MCKYDETMLGHACTGYGLAFESSTDTTGYDNPNFDLEIENGTLFVTGYFVNLLGEDVDCTPLTYEIGRVFGEAIEAFFVRREETVGGIGWSNRDYIIAKTATGEEVLCGCVDWPASMLIE